MWRTIKSFYYKYKEYFFLLFFLNVSLLLLPFNESPQLSRLRAYSFGSFAYINFYFDEFIDFFQSDAELFSLRKRNAELLLENQLLKENQNEFIELKKIFSWKDTNKVKFIPAKIISRLVSDFQGNLIINIGSKDSIREGMPVIDSKGLVGIVKSVTKDFSLVMTMQNTDFRIAVRAQRSGIDGILIWNGRDLLIKNVESSADIQDGDKIVVSQFSTLIPPLIPIGTVSQKDKALSGLLENIIVRPHVNFSELKYLFVLPIIKNSQINYLESIPKEKEEDVL